MDIEVGKSYLTRDGSRASVWEWNEKDTCWEGTVKGRGISRWKANGKDFYGTTKWDLVEQVEKNDVRLSR